MAESSPVERQLAVLFARTIRKRRLELGLSQEEVAIRAGLDRNHYQLMESARSDRKTNKAVNPRLYTIVRLADALEMPVDDLVKNMSLGYEIMRKNGVTLGDPWNLPPRSA
ncbi:MAG: helix-turn-helix domain-containing protein [Ancrocorticia sp.]|jgi:transcriptional regulator with XRE-family HTH domain|nr:helix-turn-helix domain-containing protein [Ancrocorticia sp.]MCI1895436.1 helix-turn-helix domain-containing protein [Ancrocorticia sp.]MCI1932109.1 helix-turn-helix domain-containing protein [Ancrocorticia sp.]MCI1963469.1 helix-turn-helix domain-containing protein [Ancrocorticia sp.]MCI2002337.1 helix-turn-helix domain-containing protein [Ancrocorticia sp.]